MHNSSGRVFIDKTDIRAMEGGFKIQVLVDRVYYLETRIYSFFSFFKLITF